MPQLPPEPPDGSDEAPSDFEKSPQASGHDDSTQAAELPAGDNHEADPFGDLFTENLVHPPRQNVRENDGENSDSRGSRRAAREAERKPSRALKRSRRERQAYPSRQKKSRRGLYGGIVAVAFFLALAVVAVFIFIEPIKTLIGDGTSAAQDYPGPGTGEVIFTIHEGDIGEDIAMNLQKADVIGSSKIFYRALLKLNPEPVFIAGAYKLAEKMSAQQALDALLDPETRMEDAFVIPEGTVVHDALQLISDGTQIPLAELQAAAEDYVSLGVPEEAPSLEGFLFPATYNLAPEATAHDVLQTLVDRMFQSLDSAGVAPEDRFHVVTLAALVQREAGPGGMAKVARVFLNRLDEGWKMQADSTVTYSTGKTHRVQTTDEERADASNPYNTYVHEGLPIGPISNPGDEAIDGAVNPASGPWMFFVTWNLETGETIFSTTLEEHEAAVDKWHDWMADHPEYE